MSRGDELIVDGAQGEGGGQILRTALALSMATGRPFRLDQVRAKRRTPGLLRQHLTALQAAREICGAEVAGAEPGSQTVSFRPGPVRAGDYTFAVGTAGSASLVLQTVLPALLGCAGGSRVRVDGGTHNPAAPPFEFLARTFAPVVSRLGGTLELRLLRHGFYPAGGGAVEAVAAPATGRAPLDLVERGPILARRATVLLAHLPRHIGERELELLERRLGAPTEPATILEVHDTPGPGNVVLVELESASVTEVVVGFGEAGVRAEAVAGGVADRVRRYLAAGAAVGEHLADQLLLPMALGAGGRFRTLPLSRHTRTNADVIRAFLGARIDVEPDDGRTAIVTVTPA